MPEGLSPSELDATRLFLERIDAQAPRWLICVCTPCHTVTHFGRLGLWVMERSGRSGRAIPGNEVRYEAPDPAGAGSLGGSGSGISDRSRRGAVAR